MKIASNRKRILEILRKRRARLQALQALQDEPAPPLHAPREPIETIEESEGSELSEDEISLPSDPEVEECQFRSLENKHYQCPMVDARYYSFKGLQLCEFHYRMIQANMQKLATCIRAQHCPVPCKTLIQTGSLSVDLDALDEELYDLIPILNSIGLSNRSKRIKRLLKKVYTSYSQEVEKCNHWKDLALH